MVVGHNSESGEVPPRRAGPILGVGKGASDLGAKVPVWLLPGWGFHGMRGVPVVLRRGRSGVHGEPPFGVGLSEALWMYSIEDGNEHWNNDPKPFIGRRTAEEITSKV